MKADLAREAKTAKSWPAASRRSLRALRESESAQLMMLAGIVLTISFILTALTLAQVSALEKEAAGAGPSSIIGEWRFLRDRLASNVKTAVSPDTTIPTFKDTILPTLSATFRSLASEKGYDLVLRAAGGGNFAANGNEEGLVSDGEYKVRSFDGRVDLTGTAQDSDLTDGIIWDTSCPDPDGPAGGCIGGIYMFVRLADATTSIEESILFATNQ